MTSDQQKFAARVKGLIAEAQELSEETAAGVLRMLEQTQHELLGRLASESGRLTGYSTWQLHSLLDEVERQMKWFRDHAARAIQGAQAKAYATGAQIAEEPMKQIGLHVLLPALNRQALIVAQGYSADLVKGLTRAATVKINGALRRSMMGGQQFSEIVAQISKALGGDGGVFDEIGNRALRITRTEVLRMSSIATEARMKDYAKAIPDMQQEWRHTVQRAGRRGHILMNGQAVPVGEKFYNDFTGEELRYPRDPEAPASETVNCACFVIPRVPGIAALRAA